MPTLPCTPVSPGQSMRTRSPTLKSIAGGSKFFELSTETSLAATLEAITPFGVEDSVTADDESLTEELEFPWC